CKGQLTIAAATGIDVWTLAASVQATNGATGWIEITQDSTGAMPLTTAGTGVRNQAPFGRVDLANLGAALTVAAGSPVLGGPNSGILLAGRDLNILGTVNSNAGGVSLQSPVPGWPIDLGSNTPGTLGLTQTELNNISTGTLHLGQDPEGPITITASIVAPAGCNTMTLLSGAGVT